MTLLLVMGCQNTLDKNAAEKQPDFARAKAFTPENLVKKSS